jgi:hypothetical protein
MKSFIRAPTWWLPSAHLPALTPRLQDISRKRSGKDEPLLVHPPLRTARASFPACGSSLTKALSKDPAARPAMVLEGVKPWHPICNR